VQLAHLKRYTAHPAALHQRGWRTRWFGFGRGPRRDQTTAFGKNEKNLRLSALTSDMAAARAAAAAPALMESDTEMPAPTAQANGPTPAATRPFDAASAAKVLDLKGVLSPPKFPTSDRAESEFGSWKYGFTSAMALIGLDVALEDAETNRTEPLLAAIGQPHWAEARFLHALLTALCGGTAKAEVLIRSVPDKNGYLAWRKLCQVFAPRSAERRTSMLAGLLDPGWTSAPFLPQLIAWENRVAD
jgi:hypothetical protein